MGKVTGMTGMVLIVVLVVVAVLMGTYKKGRVGGRGRQTW